MLNGCTLPFFATANYSENPTDYAVGGPNNQTIVVPTGQDYVWAFFGCFLNVYHRANHREDDPGVARGRDPPLPRGADRIRRRAHHQQWRRGREPGEQRRSPRSAISKLPRPGTLVSPRPTGFPKPSTSARARRKGSPLVASQAIPTS